MNRFRSRVRNSLAAKVIVSTVLLSLVVVWLTGSALYSQLSDGVKQVNRESSLAEARSSFFNAQYQFLLNERADVSVIKKAVQDVIISSTEVSLSQDRKSIFLKRFGTPFRFSLEVESPDYSTSTDGLDVSSVPDELRERVRSSDLVDYEYAKVRYQNREDSNVLIAGRKIEIPKSGNYEMYLIYSLNNQNQTLFIIKNALFFTGFALLFLIGLITWLVVRQVVKPVREAATIAQKFTQGDFSQRMQVKSSDEIATLGTAFNEMALSLESQISRLENLSRVQQRFVSDVSHELRTPLTTLRMASEVIYSKKDTFDPTITRSAELLVAQLDRFERLLEDLLEVSRFDAEVAVLEPVDFDLVRLIERCIEDVRASAHDHIISITIDHETEQVMINADIRRVERIMRNLLSNALDHAEDKPINVAVIATQTEVAVGVRDFGTGIEPSALSRIFDRFWRADPSRARVRGGTGLGLSIALEDARLHNGELDAWGLPGRGAHFVLTLPRIAGEQIGGRPIRPQPQDYPQSI
jgi:two-component system, OmpR family, sensor histidine kinase MtrB|uniref:MtrAB system histidine kinase MtrB n=1 Tax=Candidatus Planktophila sp. TaxID=2175601 RepID=UPI00404AA3B1